MYIYIYTYIYICVYIYIYIYMERERERETKSIPGIGYVPVVYQWMINNHLPKEKPKQANKQSTLICNMCQFPRCKPSSGPNLSHHCILTEPKAGKKHVHSLSWAVKPAPAPLVNNYLCASCQYLWCNFLCPVAATCWWEFFACLWFPASPLLFS